MNQFEITPEGLLRETGVKTMVAKLKDSFPEIDDLSLEAHLMLGITQGYFADVGATFRAEFGITGRRFTVLRLLYLAEGKRLSMGTIAANLEIGTNNTTQLIDGLVKDGLVERMTAPDDKRVVYAVLSPKGAELFAQAFPSNAARIKHSWAPLTDREKQFLIHLLTRLRIHLFSVPDAVALVDEHGVLGEAKPPAESSAEVTRPRRAARPHSLSQPEELA